MVRTPLLAFCLLALSNPSSTRAADCNGNGTDDGVDIASGISLDCNVNGAPDECDLVAGTSVDCNDDAIPDDCQDDCNANGREDSCDIAAGMSADCDTNGVPDECQWDCNHNGTPDVCDIAAGASADCDTNGIPDECDLAPMPIPFEDFDAYASGMDLHGARRWEGWYGDPTASAAVTSAYARSAPNSVEIAGASDLVYPFAETAQGKGLWNLTVWQYIPSTFSGITDFRVYHAYGGQSLINATVVEFRGAEGRVHFGYIGYGLPLIYDRWVQLRLEFDLVNLTERFYYDGALLYERRWGYGDDIGAADYAKELAALNLRADGSSSVYYDDIALTKRTLDCNSNGISDECDIAVGVEADVDSTGVPDACERRAYVNVNAAGTGDGSSWEDAFVDLQDALEDPFAQEIWVAAGTYHPDRGSRSQVMAFQLRAGLMLLGGFAGWETDASQRDVAANPTVLSGDLSGDDLPGFVNRRDNSHFVVRVSAGAVGAVLDGFTVRGGGNRVSGPAPAPTPPTGVLLNEASGFVAVRCRFLDNVPGVVCQNGAAEFLHCDFVGNRGLYCGGGLTSEGSSGLTLTDCSFVDNSASAGGGVHVSGSSGLTLTDCSFVDNSASIGGGLYVSDVRVTKLERCSLVRNTAGTGGGAYLYTIRYAFSALPPVSLTQCQVIGNVARQGAGIYHRGYAAATITNCTIVANEATADDGSALYAQVERGGVRVANSVLWGNTANSQQNSAGAQAGGFGWVDIMHSCIQDEDPNDANVPFGGSFHGNIDDDPRLVGHLAYDPRIQALLPNVRLRPDSPCVNAGVQDVDTDWGVPGLQPLATHDLDGHLRVVGGEVDMGAYEVQRPGDLNGDGVLGSADAVILADCLTGPWNPIRGDFDGDLDVDGDDSAGWAACLRGPGTPASQACVALDLDLDRDVDLHDFGAYQRRLGAPRSPLPIQCDAIDTDFDLDVDLIDFAAFQQWFGAGD